MKISQPLGSWCVLASLLTLLVLSEVCGWAAAGGGGGAGAGGDGDPGYKRGWRPQGRFGKRTQADGAPRSLSDVLDPRRRDNYVGDEGQFDIGDVGVNFLTPTSILLSASNSTRDSMVGVKSSAGHS